MSAANEMGGTVQPVEVGSDVTRDPRPAIDLLSDFIRTNNNPLHHASPFVIAEALEACGLRLVPATLLDRASARLISNQALLRRLHDEPRQTETLRASINGEVGANKRLINDLAEQVSA